MGVNVLKIMAMLFYNMMVFLGFLDWGNFGIFFLGSRSQAKASNGNNWTATVWVPKAAYQVCIMYNLKHDRMI